MGNRPSSGVRSCGADASDTGDAGDGHLTILLAPRLLRTSSFVVVAYLSDPDMSSLLNAGHHNQLV